MNGPRRQFLAGAGALVIAGCAKPAESPKAAAEADVAPPEDLMREHGVLDRIMLLYEHATTHDAPLDPVARAADIVRRFIEDYHEKLEEDFLFPRFEKAGVLVDLAATLKKQHVAGRTLTAAILAAAQGGDRAKLADPVQRFVRMYRPHAAREDTVLFPAFRKIVSPKEFDELGDRFEDKEHELFGKAGFEGVVDEVEKLERALGIYDLGQFTPA